MAEPIWIAELRVSQPTARKIVGRHQVQAGAISDALVGVAGLTGKRDHDAERGERLILRVRLGGQWWLVVLYAVDHPMGDVWNLGSVYRDEG